MVADGHFDAEDIPIASERLPQPADDALESDAAAATSAPQEQLAHAEDPDPRPKDQGTAPDTYQLSVGVPETPEVPAEPQAKHLGALATGNHADESETPAQLPAPDESVQPAATPEIVTSEHEPPSTGDTPPSHNERAADNRTQEPEPSRASTPQSPEDPRAENAGAQPPEDPEDTTDDEADTAPDASKADSTQTEATPETAPEASAETNSEKAQLRVVYGYHSHPAGVTIGEQLRDTVEVVGVEWPGIPADLREEVGQFITSFTKPGDMPPVSPEAAHVSNTYLANEPFLQGLFSTLLNSGVEIAILDASKEDPIIEPLQEFQDRNQDIILGILQHESNATLRPLMTQCIEAIAATSPARETLIAEQLQQLVERKPGARIGVVLGLGHETIESQLAPFADIERVGVMLNGELAPPDRHLTLPAQVSAAHALQRGEPLTRAMVDRALLGEHLSQAMAIVEPDFSCAESTLEVVHKLSDEKVDIYLRALDLLKGMVDISAKERLIEILRFARRVHEIHHQSRD
jgi:hypothetical protein